jgi:hypothetical protein
MDSYFLTMLFKFCFYIKFINNLILFNDRKVMFYEISLIFIFISFFPIKSKQKKITMLIYEIINMLLQL